MNLQVQAEDLRSRAESCRVDIEYEQGHKNTYTAMLNQLVESRRALCGATDIETRIKIAQLDVRIKHVRRYLMLHAQAVHALNREAETWDALAFELELQMAENNYNDMEVS